MKDVEVHELQRTNTILSVTNHVRWDVGVNIAIGPFDVSASGQMIQDELRERHTTNDTRETDTKFTITIKAGKEIVITTAKSVTTTVDTYQSVISIRGENGQPTTNVPPSGDSFDSIGRQLGIISGISVTLETGLVRRLPLSSRRSAMGTNDASYIQELQVFQTLSRRCSFSLTFPIAPIYP